MFPGMFTSEEWESTLPESLASMVSFLLRRNREVKEELKEAKKLAKSFRESYEIEERKCQGWYDKAQEERRENSVLRPQRDQLLRLLEEIYEIDGLEFPIEKIREKIGVPKKKKLPKKKASKK